MDRPAAQAPSDAEARRGLITAELSALLKLSGPVELARLGIMARGLTDAIIVGR